MGSEREFWLPANATESVLRTHLETKDTTALVALHLTNCRVADPDELCRLAVRIEQLRTLACVASSIKARDLQLLMLEPLKQLTHLEFSMVHEDEEARKQVELIRTTSGEFRDKVAANLRYLYVEVAGDANFDLLDTFLEYCPNVTSLHVHLVAGAFRSAVLRCAQVLATRPLVETFAFTSELSSPAPIEPPAALEFGHCAAVCANVLHRCQPHEWNCVRLRDLATSDHQVLPQPLIVVAVNEPNLDQQIRAASSRHNWNELSALHFSLLSALAVGGTSHATASGELCRNALSGLFGRFDNITELNLSSFHFDRGVDLTVLLSVSGCPLQALSLAPCGLRHNNALERLESSMFPTMDDLDIRSGYDGLSTACLFCAQGLYLNPANFEGLSVSELNGRLTIYNVAVLNHLDFVASSLLAELRIIDNSPNPLADYKDIGKLLANNTFLRALLLSYTGLDFTERRFQDDIEKAKSLRYLCILSEASEPDWSAEIIIEAMANSYPRLEAMHVHYSNEQGVQRQVTWLLPAEEPDVLQGFIEAAPDWPGEDRGGHIIRGRPCILCSTQTFIGLTKAHNRGRKTCV